jgi:hypothetical protein
MKRTDPPERLSREEREYFQAVEAHFIALRGKPLLLSPLELQRAASWYREGIPLRDVCRGIDRYFEERFETPVARERAVTLKYCETYVRKAFEESRELSVGEGDADHRPDRDDEVARSLNRLKQRLQSAGEGRGHDDGLAPILRRAEASVERMMAEAREGNLDVERAEAELAVLDGEAMAELRRRAGDDSLARITAACEAEIGAVGSPMDPELLKTTLERMVLRRLRELEQVPEISLFAI